MHFPDIFYVKNAYRLAPTSSLHRPRRTTQLRRRRAGGEPVAVSVQPQHSGAGAQRRLPIGGSRAQGIAADQTGPGAA